MNDWQKQLIPGDYVVYKEKIYKIIKNYIDMECLALEGHEFPCYDKVSRLDNCMYNIDLDSMCKAGGAPWELYVKLIWSSDYDDMNDYNDILHYFNRNKQKLPPPVL